MTLANSSTKGKTAVVIGGACKTTNQTKGKRCAEQVGGAGGGAGGRSRCVVRCTVGDALRYRRGRLVAMQCAARGGLQVRSAMR